jgi:hypothetical protein
MPRVAERVEASEIIFGKTVLEILLLELEDDEEIAEEIGENDEAAIEEHHEELVDNIVLEAAIGLTYLESQRYFRSRTIGIKKPERGPLFFTLHIWKTEQPLLFRRFLRVTPEVFDALVTSIEDHPVFHNCSTLEQVALEEQVAITLYRLGHYGNATSLTEVGIWAGRGHGTIDRITRRVFAAITDTKFRDMTLYPPTEAEKEASRTWVEETVGCAAWRGGWCGVDGSGVVLHERPKHYGNTWFDRKSRYSTSAQVMAIFSI